MIITIDGPIATGKSTIAKKLAEMLGYIYFDTGAMYRCLTHGVIKNKVDLDNPQKLQTYLDAFVFDVNIYHGEKRYIVNSEDVTESIRGEAVTALVSKVSAFASVREKLVKMQRQLATGINAVFEGRDIGTVVFPNADLKIFLVGRPEVRAKRRFEELRRKFPEDTKDLTLEKALVEINRRDLYDSTREISPLRQAEDAVVIDTSDLSIDDIVEKIFETFKSLPAH